MKDHFRLSPEHHAAARAAALAVAAQLVSAVKSVNEVLRDWDGLLSRWVVDAANGNMSAVDVARAMRAALRRLAPQAYDEGLREGGVRDPEAERDDEDDARIDAWLDNQLEHVRDFAQAAGELSKLKGDERTRARDAMLGRVDDWVSALQALGGQGYMSARENMPCTWQVGDTEHCPTCLKLNGRRRRLKWWLAQGYLPQESGSGTLECGGWNCQCRLVDDNGRTVLPR